MKTSFPSNLWPLLGICTLLLGASAAGQGVPPRPVPELTAVLNNVDSADRDVRRAVDELVATRSAESINALIAYLQHEEQRWPSTLPSLQELGNLEQAQRTNPLPRSHWIYCIGGSLRAVVALVQVDTPAASDAVTTFMQHFAQKYGTSEAGKNFLELFQLKINDARIALKTGAVPWKTGLSKQGDE